MLDEAFAVQRKSLQRIEDSHKKLELSRGETNERLTRLEESQGETNERLTRLEESQRGVSETLSGHSALLEGIASKLDKLAS